MSCSVRRTASLALLTLAWALACGGSVRDTGNGQGGGSGYGAVTVGGAGGLHVSSGSGGTGAGATAIASGGYGQSGGGFAATGTVGIFPAGGASSAAADASMSDAAFGCTEWFSNPEQLFIVPDMLIVLDRSQSMSCGVPGGGDRWSTVTKALTTFLMAMNGGSDWNVGIEYFDSKTEGDAGLSGDAGLPCNPADYETPDVAVAPLPQTAHSIVDSLGRHAPGGQTPTAAALVGALDYASTWKENHQSNVLAVVLVTDGEPDACGSAADVVHAASVGSQNGIRTFVIGLVDTGHSCNLDPNPASQGDLDAIAQSGSSTNAFIVDFAQADIDTQLANAFSKVRVLLSAPTKCGFRLPPRGPMGAIDPNKINISYTGSMFTTFFRRVSGEAACDPKEFEWYYDDTLTELDLCPDSCAAITAMQGNVHVQIGCGGPIPPVN